MADRIEYEGVKYGLFSIPVLKRENDEMVALLARSVDPSLLEGLGWELTRRIACAREELKAEHPSSKSEPASGNP